MIVEDCHMKRLTCMLAAAAIVLATLETAGKKK